MTKSSFIKGSSKWARKLEERLVDGRISAETAERKLNSQGSRNYNKIFSDNYYTEGSGSRGGWLDPRKEQIRQAARLRASGPAWSDAQGSPHIVREYMDGSMFEPAHNTQPDAIRAMRNPRYVNTRGNFPDTIAGDNSHHESNRLQTAFTGKSVSIGNRSGTAESARHLYPAADYRKDLKEIVSTRARTLVRYQLDDSIKHIFHKYGVPFNDSILLESPARSQMRFSPHVANVNTTRSSGKGLDSFARADRLDGQRYNYGDVNRNPLYETVLDHKSGLKAFLRSRAHEILPPGSSSGVPVLDMPDATKGRIYKGAPSVRSVLWGVSNPMADTWWSGLPEVSARYADKSFQDSLAEITTRPFLTAESNRNLNRDVIRSVRDIIASKSKLPISEIRNALSVGGGIINGRVDRYSTTARALSRLARHGTEINRTGPNSEVFRLLRTLTEPDRQNLLLEDRNMSRTAASFVRGKALQTVSRGPGSGSGFGDIHRLSTLTPKYQTDRQKMIGDLPKKLGRIPGTLLSLARRKLHL